MSSLTKSESEVSSLTGQSSPSRSPGRHSINRHVYYVQSPSRESSHDGEKTTNSFQSSPLQSPIGSPPHSQSNSSSRDSSSTRFSGKHGGASRPRAGKERLRGNNGNGFDAIEEEGLMGDEDYYYGLVSIGKTRRCYVLVFLVGFVSLFTVFSLILWGASRPQKPVVIMKSILFDEFIVQAGTDFSGVATELVSMNSTVKMNFRNKATFFGIHVTSTPIDLSYSQLTLATGTMEKFYQSRKSHRSITISLKGSNIPLYGGGSSLGSINGAPIQPIKLTLKFMIRSRAYVLGKLVKPKFYRNIECSVIMDPKKMSTAISLKNKCTY